MRAGRLRHRITIRQRSTGKDAAGAPVDTWIDVATIWSRVEIVSGRERWASEHTANSYSAAISIRNRTDLKEDMRVIFGSRTLDIKAIIDPNGYGKELKLLCVDYVSV